MNAGRINLLLEGPKPSSTSPLGSAYKFNGGEGKLLRSANPELSQTFDFEFAALVKLTPAKHGGNQTIFGKFDPERSAPSGWRLMYAPGIRALVFSIADGLGRELWIESQQVVLNSWYVVRAFHDGQSASITVDGWTNTEAALALGTPQVPFMVGGLASPEGRFFGSVSKLTIWNRLLNVGERATIDGVATDWPFVLET